MAKQTVVDPCNKILFRNEKKWTIDKYKNVDGFQNNTEWKNPDQKSTDRLFCLFKILENINSSIVTEIQSVVAW